MDHPRQSTPTGNVSVRAQVQQLTDAYRSRVPVAERRGWGQFLTPLAVAQRMAESICTGGGVVRILDPGAGTGILGICAAVAVLEQTDARVHLVAVEPQPGVRSVLGETLRILQKHAHTFYPGRLTTQVIDADYLTAANLGAFDVVISNPPYRKMSPREPRGGRSPNLYTRFMEVAAGQLKPGGQLIFLVPRSFTSGRYFAGFRRHLHHQLGLQSLHVFTSRRATFAADAVLQETLICHYRRGPHADPVVISSSRGDGCTDVDSRLAVPHRLVVDAGGEIRIPVDATDLRCLTQLSGLEPLRNLGIEVSTGKIVPFRAGPFLQPRATPDSVPLLWMQHVDRRGIHWPAGPGFRKPQHIRNTAPGLIDNTTYVLVRRLSSKDEAQRVTAGVYPGSLPGSQIGLENHLNYLYRQQNTLDQAEAWGLASWLNSPIVDRYVRITNGHTQVNATELRNLPVPAMEVVRSIGRACLACDHKRAEAICMRAMEGLATRA